MSKHTVSNKSKLLSPYWLTFSIAFFCDTWLWEWGKCYSSGKYVCFFISVLYIQLRIQVCRYTSLYGILSTAARRYTYIYAYAAFLVKKHISRSENYVSYEVWQYTVSIVIPLLVQSKALDINSCITSIRESTFLICYWIKVASFIVSASVA